MVVTGSETILHWVEDHLLDDTSKLFPNKLASELSVRASDHKLAGFVWYYNWVDPLGYAKSIRQAVRNAMPWWLNFLLPDWLLDSQLKSEKTKFRGQASRAIGVDDADLDDEPRMRSILIEELKFFQSQLADPDQPFLVPGTTQPTAADFSVYPQLERLVGGGADSPYDVSLEPAVPELKEDASLERLWTWHAKMQETCPVQFKGKKPPKEDR